MTGIALAIDGLDTMQAPAIVVEGKLSRWANSKSINIPRYRPLCSHLDLCVHRPCRGVAHEEAPPHSA